MYYNRARYLDVGRGRFWSQDSYEGDKLETLSLHKYLYASANPINNIDPSGNLIVSEIQGAQYRLTLNTTSARQGTAVVNSLPKVATSAGQGSINSAAIAGNIAANTIKIDVGGTIFANLTLLLKTIDDTFGIEIVYRGIDKPQRSKDYRIDRDEPDPFFNGLSVSSTCFPRGKKFYVPYVIIYKKPKIAKQTKGVVAVPGTLIGREAWYTPTEQDPGHWSMFPFDPPESDEPTKEILGNWGKSLKDLGVIGPDCFNSPNPFPSEKP